MHVADEYRFVTGKTRVRGEQRRRSGGDDELPAIHCL
jgi:hypothetical protein